MKSNLIIAVVFLMSLNVTAQTLIATSNHYAATAYNNQRKLVRDYNDNVYVVFTDVNQGANKIKGVKYDVVNGEWSEAEEIVTGQSPTLSIDFEDRIYMVYESNDSDHKIMYMASDDFSNWTSPVELSNSQFHCHLPVADVDSMGVLNILWIEDDDDWGLDNLIYCYVLNDTISETIEITTKDEIYDIDIANHLQYYLNDLFFAISFFMDSIQFFRSTDYLNTIDTIYESIGLGPCISYNSDSDWTPEVGMVRFLFADNSFDLVEVEAAFPDYLYSNVHQLPFGPVNFVGIDDVAPPIGYSFLFMQDGILNHGFSYGSLWNWTSILSSVQGNDDIRHPSIAYKHFNPLYVDFIWMEDFGSQYKIYHMRDDKHEWMPGIEDQEYGKGFSMTGNPNPFSDQITIHVSVELKGMNPSIEIYNTNSQLVRVLNAEEVYDRQFRFTWDGRQESGKYVKEGIYLVLCLVGDKRTARKIIFKP